ncbi:glycoside hydrolase family 3 N-terminal domain-containing protein [Catalinimonas niigatensis]|uniref:glycoside hydrolase family 3 N-terminal domain-containing protein n=1 Tax=Catalinimonas niigatensis TaxID=1397264 RepID=UPI0026659B0F|nr:glycoside hydrolase family 3 N-terminal domain-containing protein [Catalinimonas niigatensis]WPP48550.1 glycoside hydrolase family 3 N-terminal domain-containing protein [Catalinimonas niigatensis]
MNLKRLLFSGGLAILTFFTSVQAQETLQATPPFLKYTHSSWVDSVFNTLSPEERIAQLIMVAAYSNRDAAHKQELMKLINEQKVGGLIFFQGGPGREARMINDLQAASKVPLMIAMDAEWGLGMRLDSTLSYPFQMTLGAIQDNNLLYQMGTEVARQLKRAGIHSNFAPVVDVNNNPANPVINFRSFGEDKYNVAEKGIAYMKGMQGQQILTTAKHFPGHGDTGTDSHYALPQINHNRERLDSLELYPFRKIIESGVGGIMVAHLNIPALDATQGLPSTLSKPIVSDLLKEELGFEGLVVTDAMNMKGVTAGNTPGVVDKDAILAGNDMLEFTENVPKAIAEIKKAIEQGLISQEEVDERCRKMLAVKQWVGLSNYEPVVVKNIGNELNTPTGKLLNRKLMEAALTVLNNEQNLMPVRRLDTLQIASVSMGAKSSTPFQKMLNLYTKVENFTLPENATQAQVNQVKDQLKKYDLVIAGVHDDSKFPRNSIKFSASLMQMVNDLAKAENTIFAVFKNPYVLSKLNGIEQADGLIMTYQDNTDAQELAAQLIFGGVSASGRLPVSVGNKFALGAGMEVTGNIRFNYTLPEDAGMNSEVLRAGIDSLMWEAINAKAIPGGQVLVAKDKKIVFYKAYGLHSYFDTIRVEKTDLYDLASISKISSALPAIMKLHDEGKFDIDASIDDYLPYFKRSNKADVPFRDILAHQARFQSWIAYWQNTLRNNGSYKWFTFKEDSSRRFPVKITDNLWLHRNYKKKIFKAIKKSPLLEKKEYLYSGLLFYLLPTIVEELSGEDYLTYINENFYEPLGATTLTYNPMEKFPKERIVPTEHDFLFRHESIHGTVHDEGAIMMGGVSANAGLFANANDLAKLMQMYLDKGEYGGKRYISEATVEEFIRYQFPENNNRRGLGFDKPNLEYKGENNNTAKGASPTSFGHSGFTGPFTWADPEHGLVYVFMANRVNPTRENSRLYQLNTRTNIQQVLYDALEVPPLK